MDGNGTLFGLAQGSNREVLHKLSVDLPNRHGKGGQSAKRFARLHMEKRHVYLRQVTELATSLFIERKNNNNRPNVCRIILTGSADFKDELLKSNLFDKCLQSCVVKTVNVSHGFERGFDQAIEQSAQAIGSEKLLREVRLLDRFQAEISRDTGKYCFSPHDTLQALEMGAVKDLLVWEDLSVHRYVTVNARSREDTVFYFSQEQAEEFLLRKDADESSLGSKLDIVKKEPLVDWLCDNYKRFGCNLELISDRSGVGSQFVLGYGGIGGILRWNLDFEQLNHGSVELIGDQNNGKLGVVDDDGQEADEYAKNDGDFGFLRYPISRLKTTTLQQISRVFQAT